MVNRDAETSQSFKFGWQLKRILAAQFNIPLFPFSGSGELLLFLAADDCTLEGSF